MGLEFENKRIIFQKKMKAYAYKILDYLSDIKAGPLYRFNTIEVSTLLWMNDSRGLERKSYPGLSEQDKDSQCYKKASEITD